MIIHALFRCELLDPHLDLPAVAVEGTVSSTARRVCGGRTDFAVAAAF
jgi:hypothetical protein